MAHTYTAKLDCAGGCTLLGLGWNEALSSTFCSATEAVTFAPQPTLAVALGNPLNDEAGMLRPSLLPGMLTMLAAWLGYFIVISMWARALNKVTVPLLDIPLGVLLVAQGTVVIFFAALVLLVRISGAASARR